MWGMYVCNIKTKLLINEDIRARYVSILDYQLKKMSPEEKEKVDDFKEKEKMRRWHQLKQAEKRA